MTTLSISRHLRGLQYLIIATATEFWIMGMNSMTVVIFVEVPSVVKRAGPRGQGIIWGSNVSEEICGRLERRYQRLDASV